MHHKEQITLAHNLFKLKVDFLDKLAVDLIAIKDILYYEGEWTINRVVIVTV